MKRNKKNQIFVLFAFFSIGYISCSSLQSVIKSRNVSKVNAYLPGNHQSSLEEFDRAFNHETNIKYIKPSDYKQDFTLSTVFGGEKRGLISPEFEHSLDWIEPNGSYVAV